jgi:hypothetical protein
MTEAPEKIWMDPEIKFPECEKQYGCDVEYIRKDVSDALVAAAREEALREAAHIVSRAGHSLDAEILDLITKDADNE